MNRPDGREKSGRRSRRRLYERIYGAAREIPSGRVATYGQIAAIVGRCTPRQVGYAMAAVDHPYPPSLNLTFKLRGLCPEADIYFSVGYFIKTLPRTNGVETLK